MSETHGVRAVDYVDAFSDGATALNMLSAFSGFTEPGGATDLSEICGGEFRVAVDDESLADIPDDTRHICLRWDAVATGGNPPFRPSCLRRFLHVRALVLQGCVNQRAEGVYDFLRDMPKDELEVLVMNIAPFYVFDMRRCRLPEWLVRDAPRLKVLCLPTAGRIIPHGALSGLPNLRVMYAHATYDALPVPDAENLGRAIAVQASILSARNARDFPRLELLCTGGYGKAVADLEAFEAERKRIREEERGDVVPPCRVLVTCEP